MNILYEKGTSTVHCFILMSFVARLLLGFRVLKSYGLCNNDDKTTIEVALFYKQ